MVDPLIKFLKSNSILFAISKAIQSLYWSLIRLFSRLKWLSIKKQPSISLELGSGPKKGREGWYTVDMRGGADISWDLRKGIPLNDCTVSRIYSSHLLEHIPYEQLIPFLEECKRVLKKGGEFIVCVPNSRLYIDAYLAGKTFKDKSKCWQPGLVDTGSNIDQLNYVAYMRGEHKYMFDNENLLKTLTRGGYSRVESRGFNPDLDLKERDAESIYAIAYK